MSAPPKVQTSGLSQANFLCRMTFLEIKGNLGRGERLADHFFITNDKQRISNLVVPQLRQSMGTLEYNFLLEAPVIAYSTFNAPPPHLAQDRLVDHLLILDKFEDTFWLECDNCVGHELAFVVTPHGLFSNIYQGNRSLSDGKQKVISLSADKLREVIRFFREATFPNLSVRTRIHTKGNSSRMTRALSLVSRARRTSLLAEKIAFYCAGLEALLSTSQAELSHQIGERVALISSQKTEERMEIYRLLKECYGFRSKYIHGSALRDIGEDKIEELSVKLDETVRRCFEQVLTVLELAEAVAGKEELLDAYMLQRIFE